MATWSEFLNTEKRIPEKSIGDTVKFVSSSEKNFGKIIEAKIIGHEWITSTNKGYYKGVYELLDSDGFHYYNFTDSSFIK